MTNPNKRDKVEAAIEWALVEAGFARPDARAWAVGWACGPEIAFAAAEAVAFDDYGIPVHTAIDWHQHAFTAHEAICLTDVG